jgi:cytochrome b
MKPKKGYDPLPLPPHTGNCVNQRWLAASEESSTMSTCTVLIWDLPTRIFHWLLVLGVATSYLTGGEEGWLFVVHTASGYLIAVLLLFRLIWGLIGSPRSRFRDFVHGRRTVADYVRSLLALRPPRYIGHNPLGGWMVILMLIVLSITMVTGLFSGEEGEGAGLLFPWIAAPGSEGLAEVHEVFANIIVILAVIHVCGVLADWWLTRENLVSAMIFGSKQLDEASASTEKPAASTSRMIVAAGVAAIAGAVLLAQTDFTALATAPGEQSHESYETND